MDKFDKKYIKMRYLQSRVFNIINIISKYIGVFI